MDNMRKMFLLGVTGGIGSGKTTVCRVLEEFGAVIFSADREARKIITENPAVKKSIQDAFGPESYTPDNEINRAVLAEKVFTDKEKVRILNSIVHPHVFAAFNQAAVRERSKGTAVLVLEAALIYESGGEAYLDSVAVVDAARDKRIQRASGKGRFSQKQLEDRMQYQWNTEKLKKKADFIIDNNGSPEDLRKQVRGVWEQVLKKAS